MKVNNFHSEIFISFVNRLLIMDLVSLCPVSLHFQRDDLVHSNVMQSNNTMYLLHSVLISTLISHSSLRKMYIFNNPQGKSKVPLDLHLSAPCLPGGSSFWSLPEDFF